MKRILLAGAVTALAAATPAAAYEPSVPSNGIVYAVQARDGELAAACTLVQDRWTLDFGPSHIRAVAVSPNSTSLSLRCYAEKLDPYYGWITYADAQTYGSTYVTIDESDNTVPGTGVRLCVSAWSRTTVDGYYEVNRCS